MENKISNELYKEIRNSSCGTCKFFTQLKTCMACNHPKSNESEKSYRYYNMCCETEYKYEINNINGK